MPGVVQSIEQESHAHQNIHLFKFPRASFSSTPYRIWANGLIYTKLYPTHGVERKNLVLSLLRGEAWMLPQTFMQRCCVFEIAPWNE